MNIEKLHNKKIDIFGTKYTIKIVDTLDTETDTEVKRFAGITYHDNLTIEIARNIGDFKVSNEDMTRTLLHEINHAIFAIG